MVKDGFSAGPSCSVSTTKGPRAATGGLGQMLPDQLQTPATARIARTSPGPWGWGW